MVQKPAQSSSAWADANVTFDDMTTTNTAVELTMAQLQAIEMNDELVKQREKDVVHITQSIVELNTLFKGVSQTVMITCD